MKDVTEITEFWRASGDNDLIIGQRVALCCDYMTGVEVSFTFSRKHLHSAYSLWSRRLPRLPCLSVGDYSHLAEFLLTLPIPTVSSLYVRSQFYGHLSQQNRYSVVTVPSVPPGASSGHWWQAPSDHMWSRPEQVHRRPEAQLPQPRSSEWRN